jgi:hypothetical protein
MKGGVGVGEMNLAGLDHITGVTGLAIIRAIPRLAHDVPGK